ncbi:N-acetyl-1-D-myo-inositol-2-amino-2-deoxy-alpha-D-glucopyranoside deacetylase [Amycolatopsis marina]|uniref:1D-myo-inositol 2-acetamido-2-deoxy-alpha-D-glucopyranoside deacetylase n=1 Tax=Amycolatopsis marina TaxID=490629 RepID=A0A1I1CN79_9PSEU|nr:N-acetyl-1-D-myo-inositol-2-amino-2-deoxy-alpha-D-glucopyranoside deacetylase [Amycolatopsis marina]
MHAHPDDESLTTGATMARYAAEGVEVTLVTCTLGEEGEIIPPALEQLGSWAADQLGGYRSGELAAARAALGGPRQHYLGGIGRWRDSGMAGTPAAAHPRAFTGGSAAEQAEQLAMVLDEVRPQVVVTYDASGGYGHPDHIRAHEITMAAAGAAGSVRRIFHTAAPARATEGGLAALRAAGDLPFRLPDEGELPTVPDELAGTAIAAKGHLEAKVAALRAHATQVTVLDERRCFALSNGIAQPLLDAEYFVLAHGPAEGAENDLFGGLDA